MTRAFVIADTTAAGAVNSAAGVIEQLLATTLAGGEPSDHHRQVAGLIADIWLVNLTAFISRRASAAHARDHIDRAVGMLTDEAVPN